MSTPAREGCGSDALKRWYDRVLRRFYRSIHLICGHQFDFVDADHATGSVYCRAEHEDGDGWFVITMRYDDVYERRNGQWCFVKRREHPWYSVDVTERPGPEFMRWPTDVRLRAAMPQRMPTWRAFWADGDPALSSGYRRAHSMWRRPPRFTIVSETDILT